MKTERIDLYEHFGIPRPNGAEGYLTTYIIERNKEFSGKRLRPAMLVIPGGGYKMVSAREEEPIALYYLSQGFDAFTLKYSVKPIAFPYQLLEGCMAMAYIRENAEELGVDKEHVSAIGFSAGGHLCGMLGSISDEKEIKQFLGDKASLCRPDAVILSYAVINPYAGKEDKHAGSIGSFTNLCGEKDDKLFERLSIDKRINENSAPAFIWTTVNDECVPAENSLDVASAYKKLGVPFELHIFENGVHGLSLSTKEVCTPNQPCEMWKQASITWLKNRGFEIKG